MNKIIAFVTLILLFPSYVFSFLPFKNDKSFEIFGNGYSDGFISVNGETAAVTVTENTEDGCVSYDFGGYKTDWFNYFGIKYRTDAYMSGEITYTVKEQLHSEKFYLEPSESEKDFYSFIDDFLENRKAYRLHKITFTALDKENAEFDLLGIGLFNRKVPCRNVFIQTDEYKLGVDLNWGGALSYLEDLNSNVQAVKKDGRIFVDSDASKRYKARSVNNSVNLINRYDPGRLVQQLYYGTTGENGEFGEFIGYEWRYNPVQGGNKYGESAKLIDVIADGNELYVKCRPLDWAMPAENYSPSYMEARYSIDGNIVNVSCRFVDFSGNASAVAEQEMPAFYCIEPFNRFVYSSTDESLKYENELGFWVDNGEEAYFKASQNWAAFTGEFDDSFGIGIYVPQCLKFKAGVFNREQTSEKDPSKDSATSYIAAINVIEFASYKPIEYRFSMTTGTAEQIKETFGKIN